MSSDEKTRNLPITGLSNTFPDHHHLNQYVQANLDPNQSPSGCLFDPHCPECVRELWGPLLSPFAYLIKQNAQYFNEILTRIDQQEVRLPSTGPPARPPKLQTDDHRFLTPMGLYALQGGRIGWLLVSVIGFCLLALSTIMLFTNMNWVSPVILILRREEASDWGLTFPIRLMLILFLVIGAVQACAGIAGFIGTTNRAEGLLYGTVLVSAAVVLAQVGIVIYGAVSRSEIMNGISEALENSFQTQYGLDDGGAAVTEAWDQIFQRYECCGWKDSSFSNTPWLPVTSELPASCCRPDAPKPDCQDESAGPSQNYADSPCQTVIQAEINSMKTQILPIVIMSLLIAIQGVVAFVTYWYLSALKIARQQRKRYNRRLMAKFKRKMKPNRKPDASEKKRTVESEKVPPPVDGGQIDDLRQLYNHYTAFHRNPPDMDPGVMSITPTVIQVKRPNIYSYFYYE